MSAQRSLSLEDFLKASYTVVISDLHLCEAEPIHTRFPLWKKYKSRHFFFDKDFQYFLSAVHKEARGETVELILNGDIFDFDSVTSCPKEPPYRVTWVERRRGLHPQEEKSVFKIKRILSHHKVWVKALREFILRGHRVIFIIGNHDVELHFPSVKKSIVEALSLPQEFVMNVRFNEWFYVSNGDTLIEHGNQYDPYCVADDPINPFIIRFNRIEVRVPFGNLATRYMINGMGFFNPHVDSNFIMRAEDYVLFFFKYMLRAQPFLILTWFWGALAILVQSFINRLRSPLRDPLSMEDRIDWIAKKSNTNPKTVRGLKELFVEPATSYPLIILRELWLDRAFLLLVFLSIIFLAFVFIDNVYDISFFWTLIPIFFFLPFFIFYTKSIISDVIETKEPKEKILTMAGLIANVKRIVYGHTHMACHEMIGPVEHLNSGTWSPAFEDVECEVPVGQKTYIWIEPGQNGIRKASLCQFSKGGKKGFLQKFHPKASKKKDPLIF